MTKVFVNTKLVNLYPITLIPGDHMFTIYVAKVKGRNYLYYKCTTKLSSLYGEKKINFKKLMRIPVTIYSPKQINEIANGEQYEQNIVLMLKNVALDTIADLLNRFVET